MELETLAADLFSDPEMEELNFINDWELGSLDQDLTSKRQSMIFEDLQESLSPESNASSSFESSQSSSSVEEPENLPAATTGWNVSCPAPGILSFGDPASPGGLLLAEVGFTPIEIVAGGGVKRTRVARSRPVALNHEHVIAERKRREKITEKLIELSRIIPGLKKRDKASILTDAITYMREMEKRLKSLEEGTAAKAAEEPVVVVKKSAQPPGDGDGDEDNNGDRPSETSFPEIEARVTGNVTLIKIHCERRSGFIIKALAEIENQHLIITHTNVVAFLERFLDITVIAQVEEGFTVTVKDLLSNLNSAFREFGREDKE